MSESSSSVTSGLVPELAGKVLEILRDGDHPVGHRLTEQSLADGLGVSRSPVRKAMQYLQTLGALDSIPNRGFAVAMNKKDLRRLELPSDDASDEAVYMKVAEARMTNELTEEVTESELMDRYGLTRLQVQRVLNRMSREGMIDRKPGRGWVFRPVLNTVESHRESYRFRMIIEPMAILEPTFKIEKAAFDRVRQQQLRLLDDGIEKWSAPERFRAGCEFHESIVEWSNNRFLIDALRNVNQLRRVMEYHSNTRSYKDKLRFRRQCEEHLHLLDLLAAGDRMEASHWLRQHLDVVRVLKTGEQKEAFRGAAGGMAGIEIHL